MWLTQFALLPVSCVAWLTQVFEELKRLDEGETYDDLQFRSSADTLSHVLELVRIHKVGAKREGGRVVVVVFGDLNLP
jgi:hypothetical protein